MIVVHLPQATDDQRAELAVCVMWVVSPKAYIALRDGSDDGPWGGLRTQGVRLVVDRYLPDWVVIGSRGPHDIGAIKGASIAVVATDTGFEMRYTFKGVTE